MTRLRLLPQFALLGSLLTGMLSTGQAAGTPAGSVIRNIAALETEGGSYPSNEVRLTVSSICAVQITPKMQETTTPGGVATQAQFTITNLGNSTFTFPLQIQSDGAGQATVTPSSITLDSDQSGQVTVKATPSENSMQSTISTACEGGNITTGTLKIKPTTVPVSISKSVSTTGPIKPGDPIDYTLTVTNPNHIPVHASVSDTLDPRLQNVVTTPASTVNGSTQTWELDLSAQGQSTITIHSFAPKDTDDATIKNTAHVTTPLQTTPSDSNEVVTRIWDPHLLLQKTTKATSVAVGDSVSYSVQASNSSLSASIDTVITDHLPKGVTLIEGSLKLDGQSVQDLDPDPEIIKVNAGSLPAQKSTTLTYDVRINPSAVQNPDLINEAWATGGRDGQPIITTDVSRVHIQVRQPERADIVGRVYVDRNANGRYDKGEDTPINGARIVVSGGLQALTDNQGNYHIRNIRAGRYAVALDPQSVQYSAAPASGDYLLNGARLSTVYGTADISFPLTDPSGNAQAIRQTTLKAGDLTFQKSILPNEGGFDVIWNIQSPKNISINIKDPLPSNASTPVPPPEHLNISAGQSHIERYHVQFSGSPEQMTTDPILTGSTP